MEPVAIIGILAGTITTLVGVIGFLFRLHLQALDRERAEAADREEGLRAEVLEARRERDDAHRERDVWRDRSIQTDRRLDRVAGVLASPAELPPVAS